MKFAARKMIVTTKFTPPDQIRSAFSAAMSDMYRKEVPAYGTLMHLVADSNAETLAYDPQWRGRLDSTDSLARISEERHGAIRLGTADELYAMRRFFAVMGMYPVGYYDLSVAGVPVHSTAFRPISDASLKRNPFRVFTSVLRLDLIADEALREKTAAVLASRKIFSDDALTLVEKGERDGGLDAENANRFVGEVLETFRWHDKAIVSPEIYNRLHEAHRLIADVVSFNGPHINHLTPRALDINKVQTQMPNYGITPKAIIEGPPSRKCPLLLRQTSFKALDEPVSFRGEDGNWHVGSHSARFGEVEQRGIALTPTGRGLYDALMNETRARVSPAADGSNASDYETALAEVFRAFPDDWNEIRKAGLAYFSYSLTDKARFAAGKNFDLETAIAEGLIQFDPVVYEDFLPVSAAGIFLSNLGDEAMQDFVASPNQAMFELDLGGPVLNEFALYAGIERASIELCLDMLRVTGDEQP